LGKGNSLDRGSSVSKGTGQEGGKKKRIKFMDRQKRGKNLGKKFGKREKGGKRREGEREKSGESGGI